MYLKAQAICKFDEIQWIFGFNKIAQKIIQHVFRWLTPKVILQPSKQNLNEKHVYLQKSENSQKFKFASTFTLRNNLCHVNPNFIDCNILKIKFSSKIPIKIPEQAA